MSTVAALGSRLSRHIFAYGSSSAVTLALTFVSLIVLTRYLTPGEFGRLGIWLTFSAGLTILYNLGTLQGGLARTYGAAEDDEADLDDDDATQATDRRRALGTALGLTAAIAGTGTALVWIAAPTIADLLVGTAEQAGSARLAAASGAAGALWRLAGNVPRMERRPGLFVAVQALRPVCVLSISLPLVIAGHGVNGALTGTALGTLAALTVALAITHRSYRIAFDTGDARFIVRYGKRWIPVIAGVWVMQNADILLLAQFAADHEVGAYRLGSRAGAIASYFVAAVLMAWNPVRRSPLFTAAHAEHGFRLGATYALYFVIACSGIVLTLGVGADTLVKIAPPAYSDAAPIIPLLACGFVAYGAFVIAYRVSRYPKRRRDYPVLAVVAALVAVAGCLVLIPPFGSYGAAAAVIVAPVSAAAVILWRSQHGRAPVPFDWWRMAAAVALAGGLYAAEHALGSTAVAVATPFAFVVLVIGLGIVPREHLDPLRRVARGALATDLRGSTLAARLGALRSDDRAVLDAVVLRGDGPAEAARSLRVSEVEVQERTARALAAIAGVAPERLTQEAEVGHLLLADIPLAERDVRARALCERGVDPRTLDDLITARDVLRRRRRRVWRLAARQVA